MNSSFGAPAPETAPRAHFQTPEDEIAYLRAKVAEREQAHTAVESAPTPAREQIIREELTAYKSASLDVVDHIERDILNMSSSHEERVDELIRVMQSKGLKAALVIAEKSKNPHLEDDFHRFLVQYVGEGMAVAGLEQGGRLYGSLRMKLYEVTLPNEGTEDEQRGFAELVAKMEQFYAGMLSLTQDPKGGTTDAHFTIEVALSNYSDEIVFYAAVPIDRADLFEKQINAIFPGVALREHKEDYNPFEDSGATAGAYARLAEEDILPLKTYDAFQYDPLQVLLSVFSKMKREGEGAAVQIVISPAAHTRTKEYKKVLERIKKGVPLKEALESELAGLARGFAESTKELFFGAPKKKESEDEKRTKEKEVNQRLIEAIEKKIATPVLDTNIRVVASAADDVRARAILLELESAFQQFADTGMGNRITFKNLDGGQKTKLIREFIFRAYASEEAMELSTKELTTLFHFPVTRLDAPKLKQAASGKHAPAPIDLSREGVVLGVNRYQGQETEVRMGKEDRVRHMYVIGQTGTGKTTLLKNMIVQDIKNGDGVCFIDPHGTDIDDILANIPRERVNDVIYFDPAATERPMGLNMLEYDARFPEQKIFVANELLAIFNKLFDMKVAGGPAFEQYFRNSALLVMDDPASGNTLLEIGRVLSDKAFRDMKLGRCKNPIIKQFWDNAEKTTGDQGLANYVPYVTNKFDVFVTNDIMRPIIAQEHSAFNFRDIMDQKKIFLVNLSKGRLGDINSNLIGLVLVGKILMAALSRVDVLGKGETPPDFYLYIDEFQNVTTDSIATILSEARKYRLSLTVAHQYIKQLDESIKNAVFGNVGSKAVFRVGTEDAEFLQEEFKPTFTAQDIIKIENRNAYIKMLVNGVPSRPFNMATLPPPKGNPEIVPKLKELSALLYGRPRDEVEAEILRKYRAG